jgi:PCFT/HCP family folate transporter-like MFS transporter 1/3
MNLFFGASWPIGAALSGILFQQYGFYGVYYISSALYIVALLYGMIRIKEHENSSKGKDPFQTSKSCVSLFSDFFNLKHIKEALNVTFRKGPRKRWLQLTMLVFTIVVVQGPIQG